jgi:hypothetical protein
MVRSRFPQVISAGNEHTCALGYGNTESIDDAAHAPDVDLP